MSTRWQALRSGSFPALAILYLALFGAFGTESPFFPSLLASRVRSPAEIGIILAAGTVVRIVSGPLMGVAADRFGMRRILAFSAFGAGSIMVWYLVAARFWPLLALSMVHSSAIVPLNPLSDALTLNASARERLFPYGWIRGIGSAGFICGTLASGLLVARYGIDSIVVGAAMLFLLTVFPLRWIAGRPP